MDTDKTPDNPQHSTNQSGQSGKEGTNSESTKFVSGHSSYPVNWETTWKWVKTHWLWIVAYGFNFLYALYALYHSSESGIPILPGVIFTCIIFVQIYADPIAPIPVDEMDQDRRKELEEKRAQQRHKWMIFAYSFMLLSLMLTFYPFTKPFHDQPDDSNAITLRDRPIAVFIGCSLDNPNKNLSCFKSDLKTVDPKGFAGDSNLSKSKTLAENEETKNQENASLQQKRATGTWIINIGGYVNKCSENNVDEYGKAVTCEVSGGLLVPLYFIILALMGGSISLTRRLPELQKQAGSEHIATEKQPKLTQYEFREYLIFQIVQFISAPLLAILAYYLIDPSDTTSSVALAFTAGFASETILLMIRSIANKITPATSAGPQYGAVAGVVTFDNKVDNPGKPAEKLEVFLSESPQIHSITDEKGFYLLGNVPVGEHSISIKYKTKVNDKEVENIKKDTVKIERSQAIVKKNLSIELAS